MKSKIAISLILFAVVLYVGSVFCYFYEARSMGWLPMINYPYREYAFPLAAAASTFMAITAGLCLRGRSGRS